MDAALILHTGCALAYAALGLLILARARRGTLAWLLAAGCGVTALWAALVAALSVLPVASLVFAADIARPAVWLGFLIALHRRAALAGRHPRQLYVLLALLAALVAAAIFLVAMPAAGINLRAAWAIALLGLATATLLVIENLYLGTREEVRWHITLPAIALGALALYDAILAGDTLLFRTLSPVLFSVRPIAASLVIPLLALGAVRNRRNWEVDLHITRTAAVHSATLVVAGLFLLGLVAASQAFHYIGGDWSAVIEVALLFGGLVAVAVLVTSRSARSRLRFLLIDHFFSNRYDYRREWIRCLATLGATEGYVALHARVIRAVADIVDSPAGALFIREGQGAFEWAGSWSQPAATVAVPADDPLVAAMKDGDWIVDMTAEPPRDGIPPAWLAVPLAHAGQLIGFVLVAPPRAPFRLDREVFDLLRVVARQVGVTVAEQRAAETLMQTRQLHEYSKRFAFVAHDIKNVSTQLTLILQNAEVHLDNPDFQKDMLATIRSAVAKIGALTRRLETSEAPAAGALVRPAERIAPIVEHLARATGHPVALDAPGPDSTVAMPPANLEAVITHLVTNAIEASRSVHAANPPPVQVTLRQEGRRTVIDITDEGPGMTPDFVRDGLFRPFRTSKPGGSGIGAYQARDLLREAGGDLLVITQPGAGTTMRVLLPAAEGVGQT